MKVGDCDEQPWLGPVHPSSCLPIWRDLTNFLKKLYAESPMLVSRKAISFEECPMRSAYYVQLSLLASNSPACLNRAAIFAALPDICSRATYSLLRRTHGCATQTTHGELMGVQHNPPMENSRLCNTTHPQRTHGCATQPTHRECMGATE